MVMNITQFSRSQTAQGWEIKMCENSRVEARRVESEWWSSSGGGGAAVSHQLEGVACGGSAVSSPAGFECIIITRKPTSTEWVENDASARRPNLTSAMGACCDHAVWHNRMAFFLITNPLCK